MSLLSRSGWNPCIAHHVHLNAGRFYDWLGTQEDMTSHLEPSDTTLQWRPRPSTSVRLTFYPGVLGPKRATNHSDMYVNKLSRPTPSVSLLPPVCRPSAPLIPAGRHHHHHRSARLHAADRTHTHRAPSTRHQLANQHTHLSGATLGDALPLRSDRFTGWDAL